MTHPLIYVLGETEHRSFPLILTLGREPNFGAVLNDEVGIINMKEFASMKAGVWVTAYTQLAKQYFGKNGTSRVLKTLCFEKNASPIAFSNAFPIGIPNEVPDKHSARSNLIELIPAHIRNLFSKEIISRVQLVIQHGADSTSPSVLATELIKKECNDRGIAYCGTAFFYNGNSVKIQSSLQTVHQEIKAIFDEFN